PTATRLLMVKADGSVLVHSDGGSYKPLNWMSPPATLHVEEPSPDQADQGVTQVWRVQAKKSDDRLIVLIEESSRVGTVRLGWTGATRHCPLLRDL
ncbi:hypothetical protein ACNQUF_12415, partial [Corynebacterium diphtheriae]